MKKNYLLASVALFGELYKSETFKSISDILAEFIKGAVLQESTYSLNSAELKDLLNKVYGFTIPESVLRTTLKNKMKDCVEKENNCYHFNLDGYVSEKSPIDEVNSISAHHDKILQELYSFIANQKKVELTDNQKEKIKDNLSHFLMDNGYSDEYSELISTFIIKNGESNDFNASLNTIREGLIIYQGINYSEDINQLGSWKDKLTIYLSTEHLFNCLGYNGTIFKEIFDDFYGLVDEINRASRNKAGEKLIQLKYLEETKKEVDGFFQSAESIKKGYKRLDQTKVAMVSILNGCNDVSDVREKQVKFYLELKGKGIEEKDYSFELSNPEYNVVDENLIESLRKTSEERKKYFDENYCIQCLRIFTKVNNFRRGNNNLPFEKISHIYITENNFAKYLGHNNTVKFNEFDIAFAKDIDYVITKFWFKLKKGFSNKNILPKSFDVVTKAKIIIASHLSNTLHESYVKLQKKFKDGELSEEQALEINRAFKEKPNVPELITAENIDESMKFLQDEDYMESFLREKTRKEAIHEQTLKDKEQLKKELESYKRREEEENQKQLALEIERQAELHATTKWAEVRKTNIRDFAYSMFVFLLTVLPIAIGLFLKLYSPISIWIDSIGNYSLLIWLFLVIVFGFEIIGRSFLFNKDKVKNGWICIQRWLKGKNSNYKELVLGDFKSEYIKAQPLTRGHKTLRG